MIIIHEVTGPTDYIKLVSRQVAKRGFVALAVDLYEGKTAQGMQDGLPLREKVAAEVFRARFGASGRTQGVIECRAQYHFRIVSH